MALISKMTVSKATQIRLVCFGSGQILQEIIKNAIF